jgi:cytochrome c peroxidase
MKRIVFLYLVLSLASVYSAYGESNDEALIASAKQFFGTLPSVMKSAKNPVTPEKVKLGKILFYEECGDDRTLFP